MNNDARLALAIAALKPDNIGDVTIIVTISGRDKIVAALRAFPPASDYQAVIDEALIIRHLGIAKGEPRKELDAIINWEVSVALDPRVSSAAQALIDSVAPSTVPLADHDAISRKISNQPWEIQKALVTIFSHCTVLKDGDATTSVSDIAGCISQTCDELADALLSLSIPANGREALEVAHKALEEISDAHGKHYNGKFPRDVAWAALDRIAALSALPVKED